tara:strand:+ start:100 stop:363 length:264 start_codon:yes stop_codon:yes gene_type:complete
VLPTSISQALSSLSGFETRLALQQRFRSHVTASESPDYLDAQPGRLGPKMFWNLLKKAFKASELNGGAYRDRTGDLNTASVALSQLS